MMEKRNGNRLNKRDRIRSNSIRNRMESRIKNSIKTSVKNSMRNRIKYGIKSGTGNGMASGAGNGMKNGIRNSTRNNIGFRTGNRIENSIGNRKMKMTFGALLPAFLAAICLGQAGQAIMGTGPAAVMAASTDTNTPQGPRYNDDASQVEYTNIYFGSYPQSEVKGDSLTTAITGASYDSYGDAWVDGIKYRRIGATDTNNDEQFGDEPYRYFKWERIQWRVLANDGNTLYVLANIGLDCQSYHEMGAAVTWADCSLRKWLNSTFYRTAFSDSERAAIVRQTVDNAAYAQTGDANGGSTDDFVYIPSMAEMEQQSYGFATSIQNPSPCRQLMVSDYAYAMGARLGGQDGTGDPCGWWWLRSPAVEEENAFRYAALMSNTGSFSMYGLVENKYRTVVPVLHVSLASDTWQRADDASSGSGGGESAKEPLTVSAPNMQRSQNVAAFDVEAKGGLTSNYDYQWYYAPAETGSGHPISESDYKSIVWQGKALYIDLKADDVPDGLYLYCKVSDGRSTVESSRIWFSKEKKSQTITYNKGSIENSKLAYGASFGLKAKSNGAASKITYKSSNSKILSVTAAGKLTAKNYGKATITITASDSPVDEYGKTTKKLTLTVIPKQVQINKIVRTRNKQGKLESVYVEWKKDNTIDGCQYSIAYNQNYTNSTNGEKKGTDNFIRLRYLDVSKKKLYIRVRTYKKVGKTTYYGKWSKSYMLAIS